MKTIRFITVVWMLFYVLIFSFLINNSYKNLDADLGWHIKVGEQIYRERSVPSVEYYNYTIVGEKWVDHEWLMNLVIYYIYEYWGYLCLSVFFALLVLITLIILNLYTQKYYSGSGKGVILVMFFQFFGVSAMSPHLGIRVQEITLLLLTLLIILIHNYEKTGRYKNLFWLAPLFCFWANVHAGFMIGLFLLFMWIAVKLLVILINKLKLFRCLMPENKQSAKAILIFSSFSLLAAAATFLNPYGLDLFSFLFNYTNDFYLKAIKEWMPVYYLPLQYKQIVYSAVITAMLVLTGIDFYNEYKKKKNVNIDFWPLGLVIVFMYLAFKSKRHFPLFFIVSFPWLIAALMRNLFFPENIKKFFHFNKLLKVYVIIAILAVSAKYIVFTEFTNDPFNSRYFCAYYPCRAIAYIKNTPETKDLKIFNNYGWGGFMLHVWPEKKLFIDGRLPIHKFAGHTLMEEYMEFFKDDAVELKLEQYDIELVLLKKYGKIKFSFFETFFLGLDEENINEQKGGLQGYLDASDEWSLVYDDKISAVYSKINPKSKTLNPKQIQN